MRVLIGTTNPSKAEYFATMLSGFSVEFVTLSDLGISDEPKESGKTPMENAKMKAAFYGQYADRVICADSGLYFDGLPLKDPRQPGLHIRTPNGGKRLDDEEMIAHYAQLVHSLGGKVMAYYLNGIAVKMGAEIHGFQWTREEARLGAFYMLDTPCEARSPGWPLDSLSVSLSGVSFLDSAWEETPQLSWDRENRLRRFLIETLDLCAKENET
ncbi:MAG: non-canonical purine NTP pyrophosphatase [Clostridia bacterium]|nr:non-canonical purine NTP pyrophosphatase [Clostridia bacterium]